MALLNLNHRSASCGSYLEKIGHVEARRQLMFTIVSLKAIDVERVAMAVDVQLI